MPHKCVTVNVVVEEWPLERVAFEYNRFFSEVALMQVVGNVDRQLMINALQLQGVALTLPLADALADDWERFAAAYQALDLDLPNIVAQINEYKRIDSDYASDMSLSLLTTMPGIAPPRPRAYYPTGQPAEPVVPGQHHDGVRVNMADPPLNRFVEGIYLYDHPSGDLVRFNQDQVVAPARPLNPDELGMPSLPTFAARIQDADRGAAALEQQYRLARVAALREVLNTLPAAQQVVVRRAWRIHVAWSSVRAALNLHMELHPPGGGLRPGQSAVWPV